MQDHTSTEDEIKCDSLLQITLHWKTATTHAIHRARLTSATNIFRSGKCCHSLFVTGDSRCLLRTGTSSIHNTLCTLISRRLGPLHIKVGTGAGRWRCYTGRWGRWWGHQTFQNDWKHVSAKSTPGKEKRQRWWQGLRQGITYILHVTLPACATWSWFLFYTSPGHSSSIFF